MEEEEGEEEAAAAVPASKAPRASEAQRTAGLSTPARPSSTASPNKGPMSPLFDGDYTPQPMLRTKRLEEKNELQELNKRLELYILRQRERDAAQGGLNHEIQVSSSRD